MQYILFILRPRGEILFGSSCLAYVKSEPTTYAKLLDKIGTGGQVGCDFICSNYSAYQPTYDDFITTDFDTLASFCEAEKHCEFSVKVSFDFESRSWKYQNGSIIDDFVWINPDYPQYNDILVFYLGGRHREEALFLPETSSRSENWTYKNQPDLNNEYNNRIGYYFCVGDRLTQHNLKNGTYKEAKAKCEKILTLKVCNNEPLNEYLTGMLNNSFGENHRFWTGTKRLNELGSGLK